MKKNRMISCIALITLMASLTACGAGTDAPAASSAETTAAQTTTAAPETTTAETTTTTAASTTAETTSETASETKAPAAENTASVSDVASVWFEDALDARTLTINEDGTFILEYKGGGARYGTVKTDYEEFGDGTKRPWYYLYEDEDLWLAFPGDPDGEQLLDIWGTPADEDEVHFRRDIALRDEGIDDPDPNEYGYYPAYSSPAGSVSIMALDGTWRSGDEYIYFHDGSLYTGEFVITHSDKTIEEGYVDLEYSLNPDDSKEYWYNLYTNTGDFIMGFGVSGELPLNDLYAGQSGDPHYVREDDENGSVSADDFIGVWGVGRITTVIEEDGGDYLVNIHWSSSAAEGSVWEYRCYYDGGVLRCDGIGTRNDYVFDEDGNEDVNEIYNDGSATFEIVDGSLIWNDEKDDMGDSVEMLK